MVLWSLSAIGDECQRVGTLTTLCKFADDAIPLANWNPAAMMFTRHILDPLRWFGRVECREEDVPIEMRWRKTARFDRFLSFYVRLVDHGAAGH